MSLLLLLAMYCTFTYSADPNCTTGIQQPIYDIIDICNSMKCPDLCDLYCEDNDQFNSDCCCDTIIESGLTCDENNPPCIMTTQSDNSNVSSITFAIKTANITYIEPITLTLFWNASKYQCHIDNSESLFYSCNTASNTIGECSPNISIHNISVEYGLQIDYYGIETLNIENIIIKRTENSLIKNLYIIQYNSNSTENNTQSQHHLVTFDDINEFDQFVFDLPYSTNSNVWSADCIMGNLSKTIPDFITASDINIAESICVFGSRHSFLDGTYNFLAWNNDVNGSIYYNEHEHKYLYPTITNEYIYEWQIHEDFMSSSSYSYCDTMVTDSNRFDVETCSEWEVDVDQTKYILFEDDLYVTVETCDHNYNNHQQSVTFEIKTLWDSDDGVIAMTLFWNGSRYECTIYPHHYDGDYSCNTKLTALPCESNENDIKYGIQIEAFQSTEDSDTVINNENEDTLIIEQITIKYMVGNIVQNVHIIDHFGDENIDELLVYNHTLIEFKNVYNNDGIYLDIDELQPQVHHQSTISQCVPYGYETIEWNKYILVAEQFSWHDAKHYCAQTYNTTLATILTEEDLLSVVSLRESDSRYYKHDIWIGLSHTGKDAPWEWADGTIDTTDCDGGEWEHSKPDFGAFENCAEMSGSNVRGYFNDDICAKKNFFVCNNPIPLAEVEANHFTRMYYSVMGGVIFTFGMIGITAWTDAKYFHENDHFQIMFVFSALFQCLDMVSDVFFAMEMLTVYWTTHDSRKQEFLWLALASFTCILIPIFISLYQLHAVASKKWIQSCDNQVREWLKTYSKLLYLASVLTGSSFTAAQIFNSNLYSLNLFYMGLNKHDLMAFSTKKLYSIILFENTPQVLISLWYLLALNHFSLIAIAQISLSLISILVTIITILLQIQIDKTQDWIYITIDVSGECILKHKKICKNKINWLKKYLAQSVLGVNSRWVEIQKPYVGGAKNGLRLQIYISFVHREETISLEEKYKDLMQRSIDDGSLAKQMQFEWDLSEMETLPNIGNVECKFVESEVRRKERISDHSNLFNYKNVKLEPSGNGCIDDSDTDDSYSEEPCLDGICKDVLSTMTTDTTIIINEYKSTEL